ncbi:MAG: RND transporter [Nitrospirales bacterium]|nr:MAG: RND transporter [Nitrospirales bacterium]
MVGPDYLPPELDNPQVLPSANESSVVEQDAVDLAWWESLNDPGLNKVIQHMRAQNLSLRVAGLRILESRATLGLAESQLYPFSQVNGSLNRLDLSQNSANGALSDNSFGDARVSFDTSWEIDFWGRFRRDIEAANALLERDLAQFSDALVLVTAETARAYITVRIVEERLRLAADNVATQLRALEIATVRFNNGATTELDVAQAQTILSATRASIPALEALLVQAKNGLAALLNQTYSEIDFLLEQSAGIPTAPNEVTVGIPADLLRRRPDVQVAERNLAAQSAGIGVAMAELYPHIGLNGSLGFQSSDASNPFGGGSPDIGDLFESNSSTGAIGPFLSWNVLNFDRIENNIRVQDVRFQQLLVIYRDSIIKALAETDSAIATFDKSITQAEFLTQSAAAALRSVELASIQYSEGQTDFNRVAIALEAANAQQDRMAQAQGAIALNLVSLYRTLGGGWQSYGDDYVPEDMRQELLDRSNYWQEVFE